MEGRGKAVTHLVDVGAREFRSAPAMQPQSEVIRAILSEDSPHVLRLSPTDTTSTHQHSWLKAVPL